MATQFERYSNSAFSFVKTAIAIGDSSIDVYTTRRFQEGVNVRIKVGQEIMRVTAVTDDDTLAVTRAVDGTTEQAHEVGDLVIGILNQGGLDQTLTDRIVYAKTRPQQNKILDENGDVLAAGDFTWLNQGSATATDSNGSIWFDGSNSAAADYHVLLTNAPASTPWTATLGFRPMLSNGNTSTDGFPQCALVVKNTVDAKLVLMNYRFRDTGFGAGNGSIQQQVSNMTSVTAFSSTAGTIHNWSFRSQTTVWYRVTDNGTNLVWDTSADGVHWQNYGSFGRTAHLTSAPNQVGFGVNPSGAEPAGGTPINQYCLFTHFSIT